MRKIISVNTPSNQFYQGQVRDLNKLLEQAKKVEIIFPKNAVKCTNCGKIMVRRKGKNGYFWGCSGFPECKTTAKDSKGKPIFSINKTL